MTVIRVGPMRDAGGVEPLKGEVRVPGDKSIGHRAVILGAIAEGRSRVSGLSGGEDNRRTVEAFQALGVGIARTGPGELVIEGVGLDGLREAATPLDCGNSGTTMRLLAGLLASRPFVSTLVGDQYLHARPMRRVVEPLRRMGARIEAREAAGSDAIASTAVGAGMRTDAYPPLRIGPLAGRLTGIAHDARSSAQVKSALLLAGLAADGPTRVVEAVRSRDHSERMLAARGVPLRADDAGVTLDPRGWDRRLAAMDIVVPGDLSSAAFVLGAAAVVPGSMVTVRGAGTNPTRAGVLDALREMGVTLEIVPTGAIGGEPVADVTVRGGDLRGAVIAGALAVRAIDELPLLAAVAACAEGETVIRDAAELRVKESDRIAAMVAALRALGAEADERPDGMVISGGRIHTGGGRVASRGDHRIAMASAVAALGARGAIAATVIEDADNVATSWPGFVAALASIGAPIASSDS